MYIQKTDENCFLIELSEKDMETEGIKYKPSGIYTEKDEGIFIHILNEHKEALSFTKADISILPGIKGGCVAVVKKKNEKELPYAVFESESLDDFLDASKILSEKGITPSASLYKGEGRYRLITQAKDERALLLLCEFSRRLPFPEGEKEYTEGSYECLIRDKALKILSGT